MSDTAERWAEGQAAFASGDWAKIAAWYESERQQILAKVVASRLAVPEEG